MFAGSLNNSMVCPSNLPSLFSRQLIDIRYNLHLVNHRIELGLKTCKRHWSTNCLVKSLTLYFRLPPGVDEYWLATAHRVAAEEFLSANARLKCGLPLGIGDV